MKPLDPIARTVLEWMVADTESIPPEIRPPAEDWHAMTGCTVPVLARRLGLTQKTVALAFQRLTRRGFIVGAEWAVGRVSANDGAASGRSRIYRTTPAGIAEIKAPLVKVMEQIEADKKSLAFGTFQIGIDMGIGEDYTIVQPKLGDIVSDENLERDLTTAANELVAMAKRHGWNKAVVGPAVSKTVLDIFRDAGLKVECGLPSSGIDQFAVVSA